MNILNPIGTNLNAIASYTSSVVEQLPSTRELSEIAPRVLKAIAATAGLSTFVLAKSYLVTLAINSSCGLPEGEPQARAVLVGGFFGAIAAVSSVVVVAETFNKALARSRAHFRSATRLAALDAEIAHLEQDLVIRRITARAPTRITTICHTSKPSESRN